MQLNKNEIEKGNVMIQLYKIIYCNECEVEEVLDIHKPDKCPFCESENVIVGGKR